jgi:hypothetical protein
MASSLSSASPMASSSSSSTVQNLQSFDQLIGGEELTGAERCFSVLVETGVYSPDDETDEQV